MKKINKLIPIIASSAIATVATPLTLASCSLNGLKMNKYDLTSKKGIYNPADVKQYVWTEKDKANIQDEMAMTKLYADRIKNDQSIFINDLVYCQSLRFNILMNDVAAQFGGNEPIINDFSVGVSDIKMSTADVMLPKQNPFSIPTITFNWSINIDFTVNCNSGLDETQHFIVKIENKIKNCALFTYFDRNYVVNQANFNASNGHWFMPADGYLGQDYNLGEMLVGFVFDNYGYSDKWNGSLDDSGFSYNAYNLNKPWSMNISSSIIQEDTIKDSSGGSSTETNRADLNQTIRHTTELVDLFQKLFDQSEINSMYAYLFNAIGFDFYSYHMSNYDQE